MGDGESRRRFDLAPSIDVAIGRHLTIGGGFYLTAHASLGLSF